MSPSEAHWPLMVGSRGRTVNVWRSPTPEREVIRSPESRFYAWSCWDGLTPGEVAEVEEFIEARCADQPSTDTEGEK